MHEHILKNELLQGSTDGIKQTRYVFTQDNTTTHTNTSDAWAMTLC